MCIRDSCRHSCRNFDRLAKGKPAGWLSPLHHRFFVSQCRFLSSTISCSYTSLKRVELAYEAPLNPTRPMPPRRFLILCFGGAELMSITTLEATTVFNSESMKESKRELGVYRQTHSTHCLSFVSFAILGTYSFPITAMSNPTRHTNVIVALRG